MKLYDNQKWENEKAIVGPSGSFIKRILPTVILIVAQAKYEMKY